MNKISDEERKKILESPPIGTWVLMLSVGGSIEKFYGFQKHFKELKSSKYKIQLRNI